MDNFDGIAVKQVSQRFVLDLLKSTPKDGKLTAKHSKVPEFFDDSAYYYDGKLLFVQRYMQGEFYVPA